jgi:hypothetical protein
MELLTNPWFIIFTALNILALIYFAIKFYNETKDKPLLFEKLRDQGINLTVRTPQQPSDQKGDDTSCNPNNNP